MIHGTDSLARWEAEDRRRRLRQLTICEGVRQYSALFALGRKLAPESDIHLNHLIRTRELLKQALRND